MVVPCFNEEEVVRDTTQRLVAALEQMPLKFEIVLPAQKQGDRYKGPLKCIVVLQRAFSLSN